MNVKPYNIIQYITIDKYVTFAELSNKTNTNTETLKKQLTKLKVDLAESGYYVETCTKGIKLVKGESDYLPYDLIFFKSAEFDFIKVFISFICDGMEDKKIFPKMYRDMYYTERQMKYFFETKINMTFSEFKSKNNFEYFTLFVEYCVVWFNCRNIKKIFDEYVDIKQFNIIMLSQPDYIKFSANDYLIIYSILVFDKINSDPINEEFDRLVAYFECGKIEEGLKYFKKITKYTQRFYAFDAIIEYYNFLNNIIQTDYNIDELYKNIDIIAYEIEILQQEKVPKVVSIKPFEINIIFEGTIANLAIIKGSLKKNYPNITIKCIPSWLYLYDKVLINGLVFSNSIISENIEVIPSRDKDGNYNLKLGM